MPPCCAIAMASDASVTVSIAAEQSGICKRIPRVNWVDVSVSVGKTSERAGTNNTSSNVSPSEISRLIMIVLKLLLVRQTASLSRLMNEEQASSLFYLKQKRPQNLQAFKL